MITTLATLLLMTVQSADSTVLLTRGAQHPAFSADGRLAVEIDGDLWVAEGGEADGTGWQWRQLTSGPAWDHQPSWSTDGGTILFASDRGGGFDLWTLNVSGAGAAPRRLTDFPEPEGHPVAAADGFIVFVRGTETDADLWVRSSGGELRRLTTRRGGELEPTMSPDGRRIVYVAELNRRRELRVVSLDGSGDRAVLSDAQAEHPAWSPERDLIAFTTRGNRAGVWIAPLDGAYTNLVSRRAATPAWSPNGDRLVLAELTSAEPGYNGDPNRVGNREAGDVLADNGRLWIIPVLPLPDADLNELTVAAATDRLSHNGQAFDRVWERLSRVYYQEVGRAEWEALRHSHRPRALAARNDSVLAEVIYDLLRERPPMRREARGRAAVSSAHPLASAAGQEILELGGNVVDAAIAVSFALGVVEPDASGIGGYGEMVLYQAGMREPVVIEFLTRVPEQGGLGNAALLEDGRLPEDGPVLANVPGTVAGMYKAWKEYGSGDVPWARIVEPAIRIATEGFRLDDAFPTTLSHERNRFLKYESSRRLFFPDGRALQPGDTLRNPDLAWTLRQIADRGADGFYRGEVARRLVTDLRGQGNAITMADMARYFAVEREPVQTTYRGNTVYSSAPAASGGASLVAKLNLLEDFRGQGLYAEDASTAHAMIEAWKLQPSTAGRLADPSLWPVDLSAVTDKASAQRRWRACFDPQRASGPEELRRRSGDLACTGEEVAMSWGEELLPCNRSDDSGCLLQGTTAFAVADADGNMVSVTQTLGTWGGNFYVTPGLGFLYNDKLRSYGTDPDSYGARLPYARHGTSIAPTLVFHGEGVARRPWFAAGAAGNAWITSAVYQIVASMVDRGIGPQQALEQPRFLVGVRRSGADVSSVTVQIEDGFSPQVMRRLEAMGHELRRISLRGELRMGYGAVVLIENGEVRAGADPRRSGAAAAVR